MPRPRSPRKHQAQTKRRRGAPAIIALVAAALLAVLVWPRAQPPKPAPPAPPRPTPPQLSQPFTGTFTPNPQVSTRKPNQFPDTPAYRREFNQRKADMTRDALKSVDDWIKYPLWSARLTENMRYKAMEPVHSINMGPGEKAPVLEVWMEKVYYTSPTEPIHVFMQLHDEHGPVRPDTLTANTLSTVHGRPELPINFTDRGDGTMMATVPITPEMAKANRGHWGILVDTMTGSEHRAATTMFDLMFTDAKITGPYKVYVDNGSLAVEVGISATEAGIQHLKGELWGPHDEPISYAWVRNDTTPVGPSTLKLVFYGKVIRDSGVDGPYRIRNLVLTSFDASFDRIENLPVDPGPTTEAYRHDVFTDVPINGNNQVLAEKKQILQEELSQSEQGLYDPNDPIPARPSKADKNAPPPQ